MATTSVLVLTFKAPLQSCGCESRVSSYNTSSNSVKVQMRDTAPMPTKSQVQGLILNSQNHDKFKEFEELKKDTKAIYMPEELANKIRFAVRDDSTRSHSLLKDFCTAHRTKKDITDCIVKVYHVNASFKVFLEGEYSDLEKIAKYLNLTKRLLYIGRLCCSIKEPIAWDFIENYHTIKKNTCIEDVIFMDGDKCVIDHPHMIECSFPEYKSHKVSDERKSLIEKSIKEATQNSLTIACVPRVSRNTVATCFHPRKFRDLYYYSVSAVRNIDLREITDEEDMKNEPTNTVYTSIDLSNSRRYNSIKNQMKVFHGIVYSAFSEKDVKKLFCCDCEYKELRILSEEFPNKAHLAEELGVSFNDIHCYDYESRLKEMTKGQRYRFKMLGNPVKKSRDEDKRIPLWNKDACDNWLLSRAETRGFKIINMESHFTSAIYGKRVPIHSAIFEGHLEITDETLFRKTVLEGIGHCRGFGFGMLWTECISKDSTD